MTAPLLAFCACGSAPFSGRGHRSTTQLTVDELSHARVSKSSAAARQPPANKVRTPLKVPAFQPTEPRNILRAVAYHEVRLAKHAFSKGYLVAYGRGNRRYAGEIIIQLRPPMPHSTLRYSEPLLRSAVRSFVFRTLTRRFGLALFLAITVLLFGQTIYLLAQN